MGEQALMVWTALGSLAAALVAVSALLFNIFRSGRWSQRIEDKIDHILETRINLMTTAACADNRANCPAGTRLSNFSDRLTRDEGQTESLCMWIKTLTEKVDKLIGETIPTLLERMATMAATQDNGESIHELGQAIVKAIEAGRK